MSLSRNLSLNTRGKDVVLLHKGLAKIGFTIPKGEIEKKIFGKATEEAIRKFQSDNSLPVTGIVNEVTTNAILRVLTERGALAVVMRGNVVDRGDGGDVRVRRTIKRADLVALKNPSFFIKPDVFFGSLNDLSKLKNDESAFVAAKVNEQLQTEVLGSIGTVSEAMVKALQIAVAKLDYRQLKDSQLSAVIKNILEDIKKKNIELKNEAIEIEMSFANMPQDKRVRDLLHLDVPLRENTIFRPEVNKAKTLEYAKVAKLSDAVTKKLVDKNLNLDDVDETVMTDLIKEGILNDKQKEDLHLVISLAKLTGDNLPFIKALQAEGMKSIAEFVSWEKTDWQKLITDENIPLPPSESVETYAENVLFNIERTYPSQFLFSKLVNPKIATRFNLLDSVNSLLRNSDELIDGEKPTPIDWRGVSAANREKLQKDLQELTTIANTYRHLGIADLVNDKNLDLTQKKNAITARIKQLDIFYKNNPDLDLRTVNLFNTKDGKLNWKNIPTTDQVRVKKQLMAYQRVLRLAEDTTDRQALLSKCCDSAMTIAGKTEDEFVRTSGLAPGKARMTYARAQEYSLVVAHNFETIRDAVWGQFNDISVGNLSNTLINVFREIDGFDVLFGSQNFCGCEECMSILGPAAYFVDLMYFIEQHVSKPVFSSKPNHPLYLKNRRSDLWKLRLTCENTHTKIPYLTIVNEVLETYLKQIMLGDIFEKLSQSSEKISFVLPFNLPLEELRLYLSHFGISLHEIYKTLKQPETKIWRARINLSEDEFKVITTPDTASVKFRFGNPSSFNDFDVQDFIRLAGISRQQLDDLLALTFNSDLQNIKVDKKSVPDELQNFPEILKHLTNDRLDFIHRFIRLWKKTSWSIPELDLVLTALKDAGLIMPELNANAVLYLAKLVDIQEKLKLTVEELCAMFHHLPVSKDFPEPPARQADRKLFERIFDARKLFGEDPVTHKINSSTTFHHYSFNTVDPNDEGIDPITPILLGGLGVSETELLLLFDLLKSEIPFDANGDCTLDRERISLLYRHALLARALKFNIGDFIQALHLNFDPANSVVTMLEQIHQLKEFRDWLRTSPFNVSELRLILKGEESNAVKYKVNLEIVGMMVQEIQKSQADKVEVLKAHLSKSFNLTSSQLTDTLKWVKTDITGAGIQTSLNTSFTTDGVPNNPADLNAILDLTREMERVLLVFSNLKFKEETIARLTAKPGLLGIADLKHLTLDNLKALTTYKKFIVLDDEAEPSVQAVLDRYMAANSFSTEDIHSLADLWKQDQILIESLVKSLSFPTIPIEAVEYLSKCPEICQTLGINGFSLQKLADDADFAKLTLARDIALGAFSSKYEDEKIRQEKLEPYQEKINGKKRDALCDYIIAREKDLKFKDLRDIYAFFLLDVEMGGCFRTSRLVCAISSLQLYVHRCLVNLEQSDPALSPGIAYVKVGPALIPAEEWEWRKNYRVWEANRKVFLYPENYLEPDLRDNKTPIFRELEEELLQQKITKESAEAAYKKYVSQFAELARLKIAGSYYHEASKTHYFFGRTQQDPPQYYYRKWIDNKVWTPWEKIELAINSDRVAAVIHFGKLYLFWVETKSTSRTTFSNGNSNPTTYTHRKELMYSFLNEKGKWVSPQKLSFGSRTLSSSPDLNSIVFPVNRDGQIYVFGYDPSFFQSYGYLINQNVYGYLINLFRNKTEGISNTADYRLIPANSHLLEIFDDPNSQLLYPYKPTSQLRIFRNPNREHEAKLETELKNPFWATSPVFVTSSFDRKTFDAELHLVGYKVGDFVFKLGNQQYFIQEINRASPGPYKGIISSRRVTSRISTSLPDELGETLFTKGLEEFLSLETQKRTEHPVGINFTNPSELLPPFDNPNHIDFQGAYGEYYRELFFHIPFLIANHLNANQKFKEAKWWYERIFNPTASEPPDDMKPADRNWRYIEFRDVTIQKMKEILTDSAAIEQYKKDPFNPHAIARLRLSAYQKAIVMKYIDNLLDWGDYLFAQDTMESINEATMLYVLALDILGKRPVKLGKCEAAKEEDLIYEKIGPAIDEGSEFLITLENWSYMNARIVTISKYGIAKARKTGMVAASTDSAAVAGEMTIDSAATDTVAHMDIADAKPEYHMAHYTVVAKEKACYREAVKYWEKAKPSKKFPGVCVVEQSTLVFCVPPNYDLLEYWNRVEDRLFKIRNCMNISGVRRQLALFQPPINPMLLVRARAAGLSLEDILGMLSVPLPPYRFSYLIEKAKQFTQTVQNFGSALLSALEKKDVEELTLLRSVHERDILRMTKEIKKQQIREAQYQYQAMVETKTNVQNRIDYYDNLINGGLTGWEITQQISKHIGTGFKVGEGVIQLVRVITYLIPQVGSPFAMKYGGKEIADSAGAWAAWAASLASVADAVSASAGLEASFQRREQEWKQQLLLAQQELKQVEQQRLVAEIRTLIAEKDLEIHEKNMEQADELHEFYKNKFTNLGLYNYLSTTLNRLYRAAYNVTYDLAKMAERTYQFERDDDTIFIAGDNWQFDRAGLLAGERLLLQLQRMEKAYLEQHKRDYEVTQSFSMALLNPSALVTLRQTGSCEFTVPEIMFDLLYPGQYKRLTKSVRVTIPCVAGPYTNISAKLTLKESKVRKKATTDPADLIDVPNQKLTSIATSNAQNDGGVFELNFNDARYLPFEGAGAISTWRLELPSKIRSLDYDTISDVIIHISYTAKDDGLLRTNVENQIVDTLSEFATSVGLFLLVSLKHGFPNALYQLLHPSGATQTTEFELERKHFPYFLADKELTLSSLKVYLKPKGKDPVDTTGLTLKINNANVGAWSTIGENMKEGNVSLSGNPIRKWTINAGADGFDKEELDDILILLKYKTVLIT